MSGKMTLKGMIEEELMEVKAMSDIFVEDLGKIVQLLHDNESMDHENDKDRIEVRQNLLSALRGFSMKDYEGANNHVHAAIQRLQDQEERDLKDDRPRVEVLIQLSVFQDKMRRASERIRGYLGKLTNHD